MKTEMKSAIFGLISITLTAGCTSVKISALNNSGQEVMIKVSKQDTNGNGSIELDTPIINGKPFKEDLGVYSIGTKLKTILYLKNGGMLAQSLNPVNWKPDPLIINLNTPSITLPKFTPQDPGQLLARITGDLGDIPKSSRKDANLGGYLGGIYVKVGNEFDRRMAPERLNEALQAAGLTIKVNSIPNRTEKSTFQDSTQNDSKSYGDLKLKLPQVIAGELKADFATSNAYRHELNIENIGFIPSAVAADDLKSYLKRTNLGKSVIADLVYLIGRYGKVYYMDSVYLLDHIDIKTFRADALKMDTDFHAANFVDASGAFSWQEANDKNTRADNVILGARYTPLDLSAGEKLITEEPEVIPGVPIPLDSANSTQPTASPSTKVTGAQ